MSNSAPDEISIEDPLCNSSLGSMVTLDYVTPLTASMLWQSDDRNLFHVFCETDLKSAPCPSVFIVGLSDLRTTLFDNS